MRKITRLFNDLKKSMAADRERSKAVKEEFNKAKYEAKLEKAKADGKAAGLKPSIGQQIVSSVVKTIREQPTENQAKQKKQKKKQTTQVEDFKLKPFGMDFGFNK